MRLVSRQGLLIKAVEKTVLQLKAEVARGQDERALFATANLPQRASTGHLGREGHRHKRLDGVLDDEGDGPFCYDYLIDANWATAVSAGRATEGQVFTTLTGSTFKLYSTIDAALANAEGVGANNSRCFLICPGTYQETVSRKPPSGANWYIDGIRTRSVWQASADSQTLFNKGNVTDSQVHLDGITFDQASTKSGISVTNNTNWIGSIKNCDFIGGDTDDSTNHIVLFQTKGADISDCLFNGRGKGIAETGGSTAMEHLNITRCIFNSTLDTGIRLAQANNVNISNCQFQGCDTFDIELRSNVNAVTIDANNFKKGVYANGLTSFTALVISDNTFDLGANEKGIDLGVVSSASHGLTITGNGMKGSTSATATVGIDVTDAQVVDGVIANNTFEGFTSGEEIKSTGVGADLDIFHNISDAGALADVGSPVGHASSGTPADDLLWATATELTIATGAITATQSHHTIDTQSDASTDDLDTINGLVTNQLYFFRPANGARTVVVKHSTGNILCIGNADISLDDVHDFIWGFSPDGSNIYVGYSGSGGNTLDQAYDQGGAGSGRTVTVDSGGISAIAGNTVDAFEVSKSGDSAPRVTIGTGAGGQGQIKFGPGTGSLDTFLGRTALSELSLGAGDKLIVQTFGVDTVVERTTDAGVTIEGTVLENDALFIKEQADAQADVATFGQLWVNTATPNELFFTDDAGTDFSISLRATETISGPVELATAAEIDTGMDATRAMSPDAFAASDQGVRIGIPTCINFTTNWTVADGHGRFPIPPELNNMDLVGVRVYAVTAGTTGTGDVMVARDRATTIVNMLSTPVTLNSGARFASDGTIDTSNDDVNTDDVLRIDVDAIHTTPAQGLIVTLQFRIP